MTRTTWSEIQDRDEWEEFVAGNSGSVFHSWCWRKAQEDTGAKPLYLACRDDRGTLLAVCPFFFKKAGRRFQLLDSLPFAHWGGPVIDYRLANVAEIMKSLPKSVGFSFSNPIFSMVLRLHDSRIAASLKELRYGYDTDSLFILDLVNRTPPYIWKDGFQKHERQAVKHYEDLSASFEFASDDSDYADFWALYQESLQRKGARSMPLAYLSSLRLNFHERFQVAAASLDGKTIAAQSIICDSQNSMVHFAMGGYSRSKNIHSPAVYLNWKIIAWASEKGFRFINFGPASSDPKDLVHKFKSKFCGNDLVRYKFTVPTASVPYMVARRIRRALGGTKRSPLSNNEE